MHWESGLAIVEGAQGQACMASGVSPCPPLVPARLASLGTQGCHSGWVMSPDVPLGLSCSSSGVVFSMAKAWRCLCKGRERPSPVVPGLVPHPQSGGSPGWAGLGDVQLWVEGAVSLVPLTGCHGRFRKQESSRESFFFPGKGYSLSLGAVVIAGGGSGLNFHADALRSRRLEHV